MERHILAIMARSRESFSLILSHINLKSYSREFQILVEFIKDYYERDDLAQSVDRTLLIELIRGSTNNEKHVDRFVGILDEALAIDTSDSNVRQVVLTAKKNELADKVAIALSNRDDDEDLLNEYLEVRKYTDLEELVEKGVEVFEGDDLDELISHEVDPSTRLLVYPLSLNERLDGGLRGSDHMVIFARPEMGKTGLELTMACGFAKQGAKGIIFNNEERIERLRMRALSCCTGMTKQELRQDPERAKQLAKENGFHNIIFIALSPGHPRQVDAFVERYKPRWCIVDQIRNFAMKSENRTNQLEAAASAMRNVGKRHNVIVISITQAGDSAAGKAVLEMGDCDSSNTGIPGACDVMLGIGATEDQMRTNVRVLSLCKNKIGGVHDAFPTRFNPFLSKYVSVQQ